MATRPFADTPQRFNGRIEQGDPAHGGVVEKMRAATEACQLQTQHAISEYPLSSVLALFGVGVGVGVVLGTALFAPSRPSYLATNSFPNSFSGWLPNNVANSASNWGDSLMQGAKNMCGYSS